LEGLKLAIQVHKLAAVSPLQPGNELAAKNAAQHFHRAERRDNAEEPLLMIHGETAKGNYAMQMWMQHQVLSPGMQDAEEPNLNAKKNNVTAE
jgi:hypothetical protein